MAIDMRAATAATRSSPIAIGFGCSVSRWASQPARVRGVVTAWSRSRSAPGASTASPLRRQAVGAGWRVSSASSRASSSRRLRRSTIMSSAPLSSRNSARWNPSGSVSRTVCSITRGPAKPISAPGSASTRSATNANDADTPPMVGSVRIDTKGRRALVSSWSTAVVFAIWNSELTPSCMRAPPDADTQTNGSRFSNATRTPRTKRSPTTEPIEPPMKSNSNTAVTSGTLFTLPCMTTSASVSPVSSSAASRRSGYFFVSLNFRLSTGTTSRPISNRPSASSSCSMRSRADTRLWKLHFGHTSRFFSRSVRYSVASQEAHLTHSPSGTGVLRPPGVLLMRGGSSFCSQLMGARSCDEGLFRRVERAPNRRDERAGTRRCSRRRALLDLGDDAAADDDRVGMRGDRARARRIANAEAHADRQCDLAANRIHAACDVRGVEMAGAGHALERNVIHVTGGEARDQRHARVGRGGRNEEDRRDVARAQQLGQLARFLGRIVDDDDAVDTRVARTVGEGRDAHRLDRVRIAHQHQRCPDVALAKLSGERKHVLQRDALSERALGRPLDHRPVGHRIGERNAELDDVGAGTDQCVEDRRRLGERRVAGGHVRDQYRALRCALLLEHAVDAAHGLASIAPARMRGDAAQAACLARSATVAMSLSPRPERLTSRIASRASVGASLVAYASACADSSAGMMPSMRQQSWNAASGSSSVIDTYSARPLSLSHACSGPTPG